VARATTEIPFAAGADRALAKIGAALPAQRAGELQRFMRRVLSGVPASDRADASARLDERLIMTFERALTAQRSLAFTYTDGDRRRTPPRRAARAVGPRAAVVRQRAGSPAATPLVCSALIASLASTVTDRGDAAS
jgi:hypothetical protein